MWGTQYLVAVDADVVVADEARDELAVQEVVRLVDGSQTPVRVVVRVRTEAEGAHCKHNSALISINIHGQCARDERTVPERRRLPVVV